MNFQRSQFIICYDCSHPTTGKIPKCQTQIILRTKEIPLTFIIISHAMQHAGDLSSPTRIQPKPLCNGSTEPNHWTTREIQKETLESMKGCLDLPSSQWETVILPSLTVQALCFGRALSAGFIALKPTIKAPHSRPGSICPGLDWSQRRADKAGLRSSWLVVTNIRAFQACPFLGSATYVTLGKWLQSP